MFRRRPSDGDDHDGIDVPLDADDTGDIGAAGKGRPTPKRSEAEAARKKRMAPPKNRKEASAMRRERMREARMRQREALQGGGNERDLPPMHQGPVRKFIRDWVDAKRTFLELLFPVFIVVFLVAVVVPSSAQQYYPFVWLAILIALVVDSVRVLRGLNTALTEKFGPEAAKGNRLYAIMRSCQIRRFRIPKPTVRPGGAPTSPSA